MLDRLYKIAGLKGTTSNRKKASAILVLIIIVAYGVTVGIVYGRPLETITTITGLYAIYSYGINPIYSITAYLIRHTIMIIAGQNGIEDSLVNGIAILVIYLVALYSNKKQLDSHGKPVRFKRWHYILIYTNIYIFIAMISSTDAIRGMGNSQSSRMLLAAFIVVPVIRTIAIVVYSNIFYILAYTEMIMSLYVLYMQYEIGGVHIISFINTVVSLLVLIFSTIRFVEKLTENSEEI